MGRSIVWMNKSIYERLTENKVALINERINELQDDLLNEFSGRN